MRSAQAGNYLLSVARALYSRTSRHELREVISATLVHDGMDWCGGVLLNLRPPPTTITLGAMVVQGICQRDAMRERRDRGMRDEGSGQVEGGLTWKERIE